MNLQRLNNFIRVNVNYKYYSTGSIHQVLADFPDKPNIKCNWYDVWEKNKYFTVKETDKEPFKLILPPPNVTGVLHLGHTLTVTLQDVLSRWHRMKGHPVIWIPGFDHAGIATQVMVEKYLYKMKGILKSDIGKQEFLSHVWEWKNEKRAAIKTQLKTLGASVDWSREYFTMSKNHNAAVTEAFLILNKHNVLYRAKTLVNWSPTLCSTISDIEVEKMEVTGKTDLEVPGYKKKVRFGEIIEIAFQLKNSNEELIIATTRPETLFGDVAIAVHPDDNRYAKYIGEYVWHPLREVYIPIIEDSLVDREFCTGAVKVTPAHDPLDYAIAENHGLEIINVIDENGNITAAGKEFANLPRYAVREKVVNLLASKGLLKSTKDHKMILPICSRSNDIVEFLLKEQWFMKCKDMANKAMQAVQDGSLTIDPNIHEDVWYNWLGNIRDWCISRQLWWGHSIPAYRIIADGKEEWIITRSEMEAQSVAQQKYGPNVQVCQDPDVLDTWFSSAILPLTALGWPNKTQDFEKYYPLSLMETGGDILFFWVARMVMLGLEFTGRLPFKEVLLHGVLCDAYGKKMSKSLGNVISPENVINGITLKDLNAQTNANYDIGILNEKELKRTLKMNSKMFPNGIPACGADALRMTLCAHTIKNSTINFNIVECETNTFFRNKIWQASKYVLLMTNGKECEEPAILSNLDRWILSRLSVMVDEVNNAFMTRDFYKAVAAIKEFVYYEFCDFYLEGTKWGFKSEDVNTISSHSYTLVKCLETSLRILAPIMPYVTDELYSRLSKKLPGFLSVASLMEAPYPISENLETLRDISLEEKMENVLTLIANIRGLVGTISKKTNPDIHIVSDNVGDCKLYEEYINLIKGVTRIWNINIFLRSDYIVNEHCVYNNYGSNYTLFLLIQDFNAYEQMKGNVQKRKLEIEKKLNKLLTNTSSEQSTTDISQRKRIKNAEKIEELKQKLQNLPIIESNKFSLQ